MQVKVTIIPARSWFKYAKFRTEEEVTMAGITVPEGYVSDGASISRWITVIGLIVILLAFYTNNLFLTVIGCMVTIIPVAFPKVNTYFAATLIHDYLISENIGTRKEADKIFKTCLRELNVKPWRYSAMYVAVRIYGIIKG